MLRLPIVLRTNWFSTRTTYTQPGSTVKTPLPPRRHPYTGRTPEWYVGWWTLVDLGLSDESTVLPKIPSRFAGESRRTAWDDSDTLHVHTGLSRTLRKVHLALIFTSHVPRPYFGHSLPYSAPDDPDPAVYVSRSPSTVPRKTLSEGQTSVATRTSPYVLPRLH